MSEIDNNADKTNIEALKELHQWCKKHGAIIAVHHERREGFCICFLAGNQRLYHFNSIAPDSFYEVMVRKQLEFKPKD